MLTNDDSFSLVLLGRFVEHVCAKIHANLVTCQNNCINSCEVSPIKNHENYLTDDKWIDKASPEDANNIEIEILGKGEILFSVKCSNYKSMFSVLFSQTFSFTLVKYLQNMNVQHSLYRWTQMV